MVKSEGPIAGEDEIQGSIYACSVKIYAVENVYTSLLSSRFKVPPTQIALYFYGAASATAAF